MKEQVTYKGLNFVPYITHTDIKERIKEIAQQIEKEYEGDIPLFICVLSGACPFATDLFREVNLDAEIAYVKLKSYVGTGSTGKVKEMIGLDQEISGRRVIIIEDIVDTGNTMYKLIDDLQAKGPKDIKIATLLHKPEALQKPLNLDYVGFSIPNKFIIGYGLDLDGLARNLQDIYILKENNSSSSSRL